MKKIIFLLFAYVCAFSLMAQENVIECDEVGSDGYRVISGNLVNTRCSFTDRVIFNIGLFALEKDGKVTKSIKIQVVSTTPYRIESNMALLLKNKNEEIIKLTTKNGADASVRELVTIGTTVLHHYKTTCFYDVTDEELKKLKVGITKIRQEKVAGNFEKEYLKEKHIDKITQVIIEQDELINKALQNKKTFESDF